MARSAQRPQTPPLPDALPPGMQAAVPSTWCAPATWRYTMRRWVGGPGRCLCWLPAWVPGPAAVAGAWLEPLGPPACLTGCCLSITIRQWGRNGAASCAG
jgi:hypothetical protein